MARVRDRGAWRHQAYRVANLVSFSIALAYLLVLCFPQALFAHAVVYKSFRVYSGEALDGHLPVVLDRVDSLLAASPIHEQGVTPRIFLLNSTSGYAALSLSPGGRSFGKGFGALPGDNVFINAHDVAHDLVFRDAADFDRRSLSGVIAHEVTHLLIRRKFGYWRNLAFPTWKKEGYAEYVAGGSTLPYEIGVKRWKESPDNPTRYRYFRYYMMVKYLLENERLTVDDLFDRDIDTGRLAKDVFKSL